METESPNRQTDPMEHAILRAAPPADERDRLAILYWNTIQLMQRIQDRVLSDNAALRAEWRDARGLATWTEERLEVLEARLTRLEQAAHLPPLAAAAELRALLAGYGPSLHALGVHPRAGSAPEDAR